jgi:hypothetical protein
MASLVEVCVVLVTALCVALLLYGAWLCLPVANRKPSKESRDENASAAAEAVVREPRPRVRAGAGGR